MRFEWDPAKARSNLRKHGLAFEDAVRVFADPLALIELDRHVGGEERWQITGLVERFNLIVAAPTVRDDEQGEEVTRIISARRAETHERRKYEGP